MPYHKQRICLALAFLFGVGVILAVWPVLDIKASAIFFRPESGFWLASLPWIEQLRNLIWDMTIVVFAVSVLGLVSGLIHRQLLGVPWRNWGYIACLYLLGPLFLVNLVLKGHWGRARPADVTEFGGAMKFTAFWQPTDQCLSNCSFVSGEVSATVVMGIALATIMPALVHRLSATALRVWMLIVYGLPMVVILQRIATGRHFLSDAVVGVLAMLLLALLLRPIATQDGPIRR